MLDVRRSQELQDTLLALRAAKGDLRKTILRETRQQLSGEWVPELERRASSRLDRAVVLKGARAATTASGFSMRAATSTRALRGGLVPRSSWHAIEFGARNKKATFEQRSRKGRSYSVTKTVNRGLPGRVRNGRIGFAAASALGTRLVALWVITVVRVYRDAANGVRNG